MAFGLKTTTAPDFADIVKYDANAGRFFKVDYNIDTREKVPVEITTPPPKFAVDFGSLEIGYGRFALTGPEFHMCQSGRSCRDSRSTRTKKGGCCSGRCSASNSTARCSTGCVNGRAPRTACWNLLTIWQ